MFLAGALLLIALATLWPMPGETTTLGLCLICGGRGLADLLLNIVLFMPFGAALASRGPRPPPARVVLLGLALSTAIELSQFYIPGRDPSVSDVIANTIGALLGALVARTAPLWWNPAPALAKRLCRTASVLAAAIALATGLLLAPSFPDSPYYGLWTPDLRHLERYRGRVLNASLSGEFIGDGRITASDRVREALRSPAGFRLEIRAVVGPRPDGLAPLFAIVDEQQREVLLVGLDRDEMILRVLLRANDVRLDRPDVRVPAWPGAQVGDTVSLSIVARAGRYDINGIERAFTVGHGWALLLFLDRLPFKQVVNAAWIGALFLPSGFWARGRADAVFIASAVLVSLLLVPAVTAVQQTPAFQWLAVGIGIAAGAALRRRVGP